MQICKKKLKSKDLKKRFKMKKMKNIYKDVHIQIFSKIQNAGIIKIKRFKIHSCFILCLNLKMKVWNLF